MSSGPRQAMVLAAGFGRRLRPITAFFPKPAVRMMGRPLLEIVLRRLRRAGIERVVVNLHHQAERLDPYLSLAPDGLDVHRSFEERLLGTAGGLKRVEDRLKDGPFFLLNGDTLAGVDLTELARAHRESGAAATLLLRPKPLGSAYTSIVLDDDGRIRKMGGVGPGSRSGPPELMFAGVWLLEPVLLAGLSGEPVGLERELVPRLVESRSALGHVSNGDFVTVDTPRHYWRACLAMAREGTFREDWAVARAEGEGPGVVFAGPDVAIETGARFEGHVILGAGTRVGADAFLANAVCWEDVVLGRGVRLENAVVTTGAHVPPGVSLKDRVVMRLEDDGAAIRRREKRGRLVVSDLHPLPEPEL